MCVDGFKGQGRVQRQYKASLKINTGVRQRYGLSLFNL